MIDYKKQQEAFFDKIESPVYCPVCHRDDWYYTENLYRLPEYHNGEELLPLQPVICENCGYTFFLHAVESNIMETAEGEETNED